MQMGKRVGARFYLHADQISTLEGGARELVAQALEIFRRHVNASFNLIRVRELEQEVAFLHYPTLADSPFPALQDSWRVAVTTELVTYRSYAESLNPPILHRTELFLGADHPARTRFEALTKTCESIGLFENTKTIGFREQWEALIAQKGYRLEGDELVPLGNDVSEPEVVGVEGSRPIDRHLTALSRVSLSAPVQSLIRDGLLTKNASFFDYGCGKGDDLNILLQSGFQGTGWDPHYRPEGDRVQADVVNLGFVINVIEDREERIAALEGAYALAGKVLAVAAMVTSSGPNYGSAYADGILTKRNTFQKYYSQAELGQFLESALEEDAYPAAPGVFYVFRDPVCEQQYLLRRTENRSRVARARLACITTSTRSKTLAPKLIAEPLPPEVHALMEQLWQLSLHLGRLPEAEEIPNSQEILRHFSTVKRALGVCLAQNDASSLQSAELSRRSDILVVLALHFFERRRNLNPIDPRLKRDIQLFYGSLRMAEAKAHELLFSVQNVDAIRSACAQAASQGLGWFEDRSLQLHTSLVERLPPILRVYIGCATALGGSLHGWDLVKVHVESGKVTLMAFDDFEGNPLPRLLTRMKVRMRDQDLDYFEYGETHAPPVLYYKSRYVNEEFPEYASQVAFEEALDDLGLFDLSGYGPPATELFEKLRANRWEISGFRLRRSTGIPALSDPCGATFRYTDLIQCGDSWSAHRPANLPRRPDTYNALLDLARAILDPVVEYFGSIRLTYGFASPELTRHIPKHIAPRLDQHACHEYSRNGKVICDRLGAAVDFLVEHEDMYEVARWIAANCTFDRMYFYGTSRPLHVSVGPEMAGEIYEILEKGARRVPRRIRFSAS